MTESTDIRNPAPQAHSVEVYALAVGVGRNTAYNSVNSGETPCISVCGRKLIPQRFIEKQLGLAPGEFDPSPYLAALKRRKMRATKGQQLDQAA